MAKLSTIMIGIVLSLFTLIAMMQYFLVINDSYSTYDIYNYDLQEKINEYEVSFQSFENSTNETAEAIQSITSPQEVGFFDILGSYLSVGIGSIKTIFNGIDIVFGMIYSLSEDLPFGNINNFTTLLTVLLLIVLFVGILLSVALKWYV